MPLMLDDLTNLDNQIIDLSQKFDSASEGKKSIGVGDVVDAIMTILPLFKSSNVNIKTDADYAGLLAQLSSLHLSTSQAKYGLEFVNPQKVINVIGSMLNLIEATGSEPEQPVRKKEEPIRKKD